jgi:putative ABC transport system substrate-binding protein
MRRHSLLSIAALALLVSAGPGAGAQAADKVYRLGILSPSSGTIERYRAGMFPELAKLGFTEGKNLVVEVRYGSTEQLPALARDLVATRPAAVIAAGSAAIQAIRQEAASMPVIGAFIGMDPIAAGFAASLARPGGMVTGIVMLAPELDAKRLQLLHEAVPDRSRVAVLAADAQRDAANVAAVKQAAGLLAGVQLLPLYAAKPEAYAAAFAQMRGAGAGALAILSAPELFTDASTLAALAVEAGLPTVCEWRLMAEQGCLIGYGPDRKELQRRVADYVARILRGTAPGELPIERPTHFEFAVNLKTAKALGLTLPPSILARADEVIE